MNPTHWTGNDMRLINNPSLLRIGQESSDRDRLAPFVKDFVRP